MTYRERRLGFTVVELLAVMGCITVLIALLLIGVQAVREASRKIECQNNFRQLAIALQSFENAKRELPMSLGKELLRQYSPHVQILPYLEQSALFKEITARDVFHLFAPPFVDHQLATLSCPSDGRGGANIRYCVGSDPLPWKVNGIGGDGPFDYSKAIRLSEITDGLSNTAFMSERIRGIGSRKSAIYLLGIDSPTITPGELRNILANMPPFVNENAHAGAHWIVGNFLHSWYNHVSPPNSLPDATLDGHLSPLYFQQSASIAASSYHGGVNVGLGDSSVHFVSSNIDATVWASFGDINDAATFHLE